MIPQLPTVFCSNGLLWGLHIQSTLLQKPLKVARVKHSSEKTLFVVR